MLILSYLCVGPPMVLIPQVSPPKPSMYLPFLPHTLHVPPISFFLISSHKQKHRPWSSSLCVSYISLLPRLFQTQISSSTPYFETLSLCSFLNVRDQVSHPHETIVKTTSLCILTFIFWIANWKTEFLDWTVVGIPWVQSALNFFMNAILIVKVVAKSLN